MIVIMPVIGSFGNAEDATMIVIMRATILIIFMMIVITIITFIIGIMIVIIISRLGTIGNALSGPGVCPCWRQIDSSKVNQKSACIRAQIRVVEAE